VDPCLCQGPLDPLQPLPKQKFYICTGYITLQSTPIHKYLALNRTRQISATNYSNDDLIVVKLG